MAAVNLGWSMKIYSQVTMLLMLAVPPIPHEVATGPLVLLPYIMSSVNFTCLDFMCCCLGLPGYMCQVMAVLNLYQCTSPVLAELTHLILQ